MAHTWAHQKNRCLSNIVLTIDIFEAGKQKSAYLTFQYITIDLKCYSVIIPYKTLLQSSVLIKFKNTVSKKCKRRTHEPNEKDEKIYKLHLI